MSRIMQTAIFSKLDRIVFRGKQNVKVDTLEIEAEDELFVNERVGVPKIATSSGVN